MEYTLYKNGRIGGCICDFEVIDGKFGKIGKIDADGTSLDGLDVFPGLIDLHCHGALGNDAYYGFDKLPEMSLFMAKNGTTCWYPTIGCIPQEKFDKAMEENYEGIGGAYIPGFHLEGPYISGEALGSGLISNIAAPKNHHLPHIEKVKLMNVAPEIDGVLDFIKNHKNIKFALGHTNADFNLALAAIEAGADSLTHIFNAMPGLHHRDPGPIGAAIEKDAYVQLICDGIHIHKSVVKAVYRIFGRDRVILISDAVCGLGLPEGEHIIHGNEKRIIKDGAIRTETGKLAGSASTLFMDVKKAIEFGIPREDAFHMASATPADYMGIKKGHIKTGFDADFILVDKNNNLVSSYVAGKKIL